MLGEYLLVGLLDTFSWRLLDVFNVLVDWNPLEELGNLETRLSGTNRPGGKWRRYGQIIYDERKRYVPWLGEHLK